MFMAVALSAMAAKPKIDIKHVEPLSWWVGMEMPLQLMVNGDAIAECDVEILPAAAGVEITAIHKAESPNYIFEGCNPELGWLFACCYVK